MINTEHVQRITLNSDSAFEIESMTGEFITNTVITIPTLDNITSIEDRLSVVDDSILNNKNAIDSILEGSPADLDTLAEIVEAYKAADTAVLDDLSTRLLLYTKNEDLEDATDIAIGFATQAGTNAVSIGAGSSAVNYGISIGDGSDSLSSGSLAIGADTRAGFTGTDHQGIAIGNKTIVEGNRSICVGSNSEIMRHVTDTTVIGFNFKSALNSNALYIAQVRLDSSPNHVMYFNNLTNELTYGINTSEDRLSAIEDRLSALEAS